MDNHIEFINGLIQSTLESFPRAVDGEAPMEVLKKKADKVRMLKEILEVLEINRGKTW